MSAAGLLLALGLQAGVPAESGRSDRSEESGPKGQAWVVARGGAVSEVAVAGAARGDRSGGAGAEARPLGLGEVLRSVADQHPQLGAADERVRGAAAAELAARGGFDPLVRARGQWAPLGGYPNGRFDVEVRQATPLWGLQVYGGWRLGRGVFAPYDYRAKTASGGEVRAGVTLPLWQGGPIDRRRADIAIAVTGRDLAGAEREAKVVELERVAAKAYWSWVLAGLRVEVSRHLLALAERRDAGLTRQIEAGSVPAVEGLDNRRAVLEREARLVAAERSLQQAALELARHLRDARGQIVAPDPSRLPAALPEPTSPPQGLEAMVEEAWRIRPDLQAMSLRREVAGVERKVARNRAAPRIDLDAFVAKDLGYVAPADRALLPTEFAAGVTVEVPVALRQVRGESRRAEAEVRRIDADVRYLRDVIATEVRDAHAAMVAAHRRVGLARAQVEAARALAQAERTRFERGDGTLLFVNLREQAEADAELLEIEALADFHRAAVDLRAAIGRRIAEG